MSIDVLKCEPHAALVISTSRRNAHVVTSDGRIAAVKAASKIETPAAGDRVEMNRDRTMITAVLPRKNCLVRTYRGQAKQIAANLDMLFIVTAVTPLFNTIFIDRVIATCELHEIPYSVVVNKCDLGLEATTPLIQIYEQLGIRVIYTTVKAAGGLDRLQEALIEPSSGIVALAGISGVGKSSILNRLAPEANRKTGEISRKTGKGRQTTSQAVGHVYAREGLASALIIDLPGLQSFGVTHLSKNEVARGFTEISSHAAGCEYADCFHMAEPNCAVKAAVESGEISASRFISYLHMLEEIEEAQPY